MNGMYRLLRKEYEREYLFEDNEGILLTSDELNELSSWEIEDRQIRVFEI